MAKLDSLEKSGRSGGEGAGAGVKKSNEGLYLLPFWRVPFAKG